MTKVVIASNNSGKLKEFTHLFEPLEIKVFPQSVFNVAEVEEPFQTFIENALVKARHASKQTGLPALADDSGICVDVLNGRPGVYSARYAGEPKSDQRNNQLLIENLRTKQDRRAHYYCIIVLVRYADDPQPIITDGSWYGRIVLEPRGTGGFGYDPYFYLPDLGKTAAELPIEDKNLISHRGKALMRLTRYINEEALGGLGKDSE
ncbi:MAG: RdgB/HAM1 family non-canonical purine NTP pyrophosphatase [Nitrosomonadaceae bacterium]|nr:RdgB/HAM1 family non-canonical purine NTP pyrophosphatase [Nitrosomonadaceae bacterium]